MLLGHWIEMRSLAQTSSALDSLAALLPDTAERIDGDQVTQVSPADLQVGDVVMVRPGGRVPADGHVVDGTADVDESMITGESRPVQRSSGDRVVAGTVSTDSALRIEISAVGRTPPWPGSSCSSAKPSRRPPVPSAWPTRPPDGCSGSRSSRPP